MNAFILSTFFVALISSAIAIFDGGISIGLTGLGLAATITLAPLRPPKLRGVAAAAAPGSK